MSRLGRLHPLRLFQSQNGYLRLPTHGNNGNNASASTTDDGDHDASLSGMRWSTLRYLRLRMSATRLAYWVFAGFVVLLLVAGRQRFLSQSRLPEPQKIAGNPEGGRVQYPWQRYNPLKAYYNGVWTLTPGQEHEAENQYNRSAPQQGVTKEQAELLNEWPALDPVVFDPYPAYGISGFLAGYHKREQCYLDAEEHINPPDVMVYPGLPLNLPDPLYGSYSELGMRDDVCFDRYGRFAAYGYGYNSGDTKVAPKYYDDDAGSEKVFAQIGKIDYSDIDWGTAQQRCHEKNKARFEENQAYGMKRVPKQAYVLRTWVGYDYQPAQILSLRAMINELALKSGGEYDVHMLVHVRDDSLPIWADAALYRRTLEENVPREFWNISTLWSEQLMRMYYPSPFGPSVSTMAESTIHGVYRSAHFALQWFSQQHPEYEFIWNWEMDVRLTGHYYEFNNRIGEWAKKQPRKGLWERNRKFWIPKRHGDFSNLTAFVERETAEVGGTDNSETINGPWPIWGAVRDWDDEFDPHYVDDKRPDIIDAPHSYEEDKFEWGVGEDADLIVFNPIFDPTRTNWVFRNDVTGYNMSKPPPPRRAAIITIARLSRRLLNTMHYETWRRKHTMFPEMWPSTIALHYGLKAVYAPHPVHFNRDWDLGYMDAIFNYPADEQASPFGWGEHNLLGSTFYYNSEFSATLWRRWLGLKGVPEDNVPNTGRMCLRPVLLHPVKKEEWIEGRRPDT